LAYSFEGEVKIIWQVDHIRKAGINASIERSRLRLTEQTDTFSVWVHHAKIAEPDQHSSATRRVVEIECTCIVFALDFRSVSAACEEAEMRPSPAGSRNRNPPVAALNWRDGSLLDAIFPYEYGLVVDYDLQSPSIPLKILILFVLCTTAWSRVLVEQRAYCPSFSSSSTSRFSMQVSSASHGCDRQLAVTTPMDRQKAAVTAKLETR
jgi:hypothetical protein